MMMGAEKGWANGQLSAIKRISRRVVGDQGTERLMVVVSPSTVVDSEMQSASSTRPYPIR